MSNFYRPYFQEYADLAFSDSLYETLDEFKSMALEVKATDSKLIFAGNGASAAISAHAAVDFTKQAKIRGITFNEADLITCFSNDYGYENWMSEAIKAYSKNSDAIVLTSVSGESPSIVNAAITAKSLGLKVVTFTGRDSDNTLKSHGDINFWVDSHAYNIVECIHMIWVTTVIDAIVGNAVYEVS
jgi:D-sedoheptulose 7-phosphate isomerase|tara:strand:+ start:582 stop:1139 length:558 start_codon:yes stop_codon:yes gene_type:complete